MSRSKRTRNLPESLSDWTMEQLQAELAHCRTRIQFFEHIGQRRNYIETLKRLKQVLKALEEKLKDDD